MLGSHLWLEEYVLKIKAKKSRIIITDIQDNCQSLKWIYGRSSWKKVSQEKQLNRNSMKIMQTSVK